MDITFLSSLVGIILLSLPQKSLEDPVVVDHPDMHNGKKQHHYHHVHATVCSLMYFVTFWNPYS